MIPEECIDKIYCCNCKIGLKKIPDNSVDLVFTSPPYADLRDYGHKEGTINPDDYAAIEAFGEFVRPNEVVK